LVDWREELSMSVSSVLLSTCTGRVMKEWCDAFIATNINKVFSGYQPCHFIKNQHLRDHLEPSHHGNYVTICPDHPTHTPPETMFDSEHEPMASYMVESSACLAWSCFQIGIMKVWQ
jgi:hypothetical protein